MLLHSAARTARSNHKRLGNSRGGGHGDRQGADRQAVGAAPASDVGAGGTNFEPPVGNALSGGLSHRLLRLSRTAALRGRQGDAPRWHVPREQTRLLMQAEFHCFMQYFIYTRKRIASCKWPAVPLFLRQYFILFNSTFIFYLS